MITVIHTRPVGGGAEKQMLDLVSRWARTRKVRVAFLEGREVPQGAVPDDVQVVALAGPMPAGFVRRLGWMFRSLRSLRRMLRSTDGDCIFTFLWLPTVAVASCLPRRRRGAFIWSVQSDLRESIRVHRDWWLRTQLIRLAARRRVDAFIGISTGQGAQSQSLLGAPPDKFHIIPNSVDLDSVRKLAEERIELPRKSEELRLITIARLHPQKGLSTLIDALSALRRDRPEGWACWILGEGPDRVDLEREIETAGLADRVHLAGFVTKPYPWLRSSDIFVLSSRWEPFGIVLVEALALGVPVVSTATDGANEILTPDVDGVVVPREDPSAMADALERLIAAPDLRAELARSGLATAERYDVGATAQRYLELADSVGPADR